MQRYIKISIQLDEKLVKWVLFNKKRLPRQLFSLWGSLRYVMSQNVLCRFVTTRHSIDACYFTINFLPFWMSRPFVPLATFIPIML